jgi:hypothetical protein
VIAPSTEIEQLTSYRVINNTDETMPPNAVVYISEANAEGVFLGVKPTDNNMLEVVFNSAVALEPGEEGTCYSGPIVNAGLDDTDDAPAEGDTRGTKADDWYLRQGQTGWRVLKATSDNRFALVSSLIAGITGQTYIVRIPDPATTDAKGYVDGVFIQNFSGDPVTYSDGEQVKLLLVGG